MKNTIILFNLNLPNQPSIVYDNAEIDRPRILSDNKGRSGIYMFTHKESSKKYIGSAVDLFKRLSDYYSFLYLKRTDNYISRALLHHTHSAFSLTILDYIDILSSSNALETRILILKYEQYYLDFIFSTDKPNTYNILKTAGSLLGYKYTEESILKISEAMSAENYFNFRKSFSKETKRKISEVMISKSHSAESKTNIDLAHKGKSLSNEIKAKISLAKETAIYVYDCDGSLVNSFTSANKTALYFKCSINTIFRYAQNGQIFLKIWVLSTSLKENF